MFLFRRQQNEQKRYEKRKNEKTNRTDLSRKKVPVDFLGICIIASKIQRTIESREEKKTDKKNETQNETNMR